MSAFNFVEVIPRVSDSGRPSFGLHASLIAIALVVCLVGCGGDAKKPTAASTATVAATGTAAAQSHAEFVRALDATCRGSVDDLVKEANSAGNDTAQLAAIMHRVLARIEPSTRARQRLVAPPEDAAAFRRYQRAQGRLVGVYGRLEDMLRSGDTSQVQYLLGLLPGIRKARTTAAIDLGSRRCGG